LGIEPYCVDTNGSSLDTVAAICVEKISAKFEGKKAIAVGHSLGGMIAATAVKMAPSLFQGLVLCNARNRNMSDEERRNKTVFIKNLDQCHTEIDFQRLLKHAFFIRQDNLSPQDLELLISEVKTVGLQTFRQQIQLNLEAKIPDYDEILNNMPITVIEGTRDNIIPAPGWEQLEAVSKKFPFAFKRVKKNGGHLSILKHPKDIADEIVLISNQENKRLSEERSTTCLPNLSQNK
ncbi:MAG TPA: alpha/beta fold hydrolase, partial [Legionellaceae bacterium]|nr:alpha/beta fold hydrolase [Legionellaceae bacterium]